MFFYFRLSSIGVNPQRRAVRVVLGWCRVAGVAEHRVRCHSGSSPNQGTRPLPAHARRPCWASLRELGSVTVEALAGRFGVTLQTVRRDVTRLSEAGLLERFHGGVRLP